MLEKERGTVNLDTRGLTGQSQVSLNVGFASPQLPSNDCNTSIFSHSGRQKLAMAQDL